MSHHSQPSIETIIEPTRGFRFVSWRELHEYQDLMWLLVWRDIVSRYKQTVLGPLWFVVQPILTTLVFTVVFGKVAQIPTGGVPPILFYLCGLLGWNYFSGTLQSTGNTLVSNANLFGKVYFPRLIVPLAGAISNLVAFAIQLLTFAGFFIAYKISPQNGLFTFHCSIIFFPLVVLQVVLLSLGVGLWLAALTTKFRDFSVLSGFVVQLWMYGTPVIYPLTQIPLRWRVLVCINPMTMPTECFRQMLLGVGTTTTSLVIVSVAVTLLTVISGVFVFQRIEKTFVDVV